MKTPIIILHGWGLRGSVYTKVTELLHKSGHDVYSFDLPGFGSEPLISDSMTLSDYVEFVHQFLIHKKIKKAIFIGHSFGGRIALKFENQYRDQVQSLVLTGAPVIRRMPFAKRILFYLTVVGGVIFEALPKRVEKFLRKALYFTIGEWDYYNAGPLEQTFKDIINEDLKQYARKVKVPVLLVWGADDRLTPLQDVAEIKKLIPHAASVIVPDVGHKLPYEKPLAFYNAISESLI